MGPIEKPFGTAQRAGAGALSQMRYEKSVERIATLVTLKIFGRGNHARRPGIEGVIAGERLGKLLGAIDRQQLFRFAGLTWPNHTRPHKKSRERVTLRVM
jgi:hypothetical protein